MDFKDFLKKYREKRGLSQEDLASEVGIHRMGYAKIEAGWRGVGAKSYQKFLNYFQNVKNREGIFALLKLRNFNIEYLREILKNDK